MAGEDAALVAGVDFGASALRIAVASPDGEILARHEDITPHGADADAVVETVLDGFHAVCREVGIEPADLRAVGIGSIGPLDLTAGSVTNAANLPIEGPIPLRSAVEALVDGSVVMCNDAEAGVIAERRYANAPDNTVYLTLSTGIGAGVSMDGHVLQGREGNAGEVGHFVVEPDGRRCGCGGAGHWEAYCAGSAIPSFAMSLASEAAVETELPIGEPGFGAAAVFDAPNDPLASRVLDRLVAYNAIGLAAVVNAYAPALIAIGGAVALRNEEFVIDPLPDRLEEHVLTTVPEIRPTKLGEDAVLRGALAIAQDAIDLPKR